MDWKADEPFKYLVISFVILLLFISWEIGKSIPRNFSWNLAWQTISGKVSADCKIKNKYSDKIMDVSECSTSDGASIIQWTDKNGDNQIWRLIQAKAGCFKIVNRYSGKVLDIMGGSAADGAPVVQWTDNGGDSQLWQKINAGSGYYKLKNKKSGKLLDVSNCSKDDGAGIIQWSDHSGDNQMWSFN